MFFFFSSRRRHTRFDCDWSSDVCSSDLNGIPSNQNNLDAKYLEHTWSGAKSRANLTWHITPEILSYVTWSQGFRPGGLNPAQADVTRPLARGIVPPGSYPPRHLINYQLRGQT